MDFNIDKRNLKIMELYYKGKTVLEIFNHKENGKNICIKVDGKPLSLRGLQKIIHDNKDSTKELKNKTIKVYEDSGNKKSNLPLDKYINSIFSEKNVDKMLSKAGYFPASISTIGTTRTKFNKQKIAGLLYIYEYKLNNGTRFLKFGISNPIQVERRISLFKSTNKRKGELSNYSKKIKHFFFEDYRDAEEMEIKLKRYFKNKKLLSFISKNDIPDGYSETLRFSSLKYFVDFFEKINFNYKSYEI